MLFAGANSSKSNLSDKLSAMVIINQVWCCSVVVAFLGVRVTCLSVSLFISPHSFLSVSIHFFGGAHVLYCPFKLSILLTVYVFGCIHVCFSLCLSLCLSCSFFTFLFFLSFLFVFVFGLCVTKGYLGNTFTHFFGLFSVYTWDLILKTILSLTKCQLQLAVYSFDFILKSTPKVNACCIYTPEMAREAKEVVKKVMHYYLCI